MIYRYFCLLILILIPTIAYSTDDLCPVYSNKAHMQEPISVLVYVDNVWASSECNPYPGYDIELNIFDLKTKKLVYMEKSCHDQFYEPQCNGKMCSWTLNLKK